MKIVHTLFSWLITCIGGSILLLLGVFLWEGNSGHLLDNTTSEGALVILVYGTVGSLLFSIPAFILYHLLGTLAYRNARDNMIAKVLLSFYAALAPLLSLWIITTAFTGERNLFQRSGDSQVLYVLLPYMICFVACVWLFGKKQTDETQLPVAEQDGFPREVITAIAIMIIVAELWGLFNMFKYWQYYTPVSRIYTPLMIVLRITGLILLLKRKSTGWYIMSVMATWFTLSSLLALGYAVVKKHEYLQAYRNAGWILFFLLEIALLVLLLLPAMRRYFRVTPEKLGAVIIAGVLLAAAFFFEGL